MSAADRGWYPHIDPMTGNSMPIKVQKTTAPRNKSTITEAEITALVDGLNYVPEVFEELAKKSKRRWWNR